MSNGLYIQVGSQQLFGALDPDVGNMVADRISAARAETTGELTHREFAQRRQIAQGGDLLQVCETIINQPQAPRREFSRRRDIVEVHKISSQLDCQLTCDELDQHFTGEAGVPELLSEPQQQVTNIGVRNIETGLQAAAGPLKVAVKPLGHRFWAEVA